VLALSVIGGVIAASYVYHRLDEEVRRQVEAKIAQHYSGLKVSVRSASLLKGEGIEVRGLSIIEPGAEGPAELIYVDEAFLRCATDLQQLIAGNVEAKEITIRRSTLRATRRPDGQYSSMKLLPVPKFSDRPPKVIIENGTVEVFDPLQTPCSTLMLRDVNLTLFPPNAPRHGETASTVRKLQGTLSGDHLHQVELEGEVDLQRKSWAISGSIEGLDVSPELRDALPSTLAAKLVSLGGLRGQAVVNFRVVCDPTDELLYRYNLSGRLTRGRVDDARLPHPLTDMRAKFRLSNEQLNVDELVARSNQATLRMSYQQEGFQQTSRRLLRASIRRLELDRELLGILPNMLREQWHKYRPSGLIDTEVNLFFDGQNWHPDVSANCLNVSFLHHKFPYRLDHGKGIVQLKEDALDLHLTAYSGSRPIRLDAEVSQLTSAPVGWFEAKGDELQLDEKLLTALPDRAGALVRSLHPDGTMNFFVHIARESPDEPICRHLQVGLNRCSIRYENFPYPLSNIRGTLEMVDNRWVFHNLEGTNDTGRVICEGYLMPGSQGNELLLRFAATDVPLEEELRDALKPCTQRIWNELRPRGRIDLHAEVRYLPGPNKLSVGVRARPQSETALIYPVHFPYRMDRLQGELIYDNGHVTLERFKAEHGSVKMAATGNCDLSANGDWHFHFGDLTVDRLRFDRELTTALPGRLKKAIGQLGPDGPIHLRGSFDLFGGSREGDPIRSQWDLTAGVHQGSIGCGVKLENIYGSLTFKGAFDGREFYSEGELAIDSLTCKDYQFTEVRGPFRIDDRWALLGSWVDHRRADPASRAARQRRGRPLSAKLFGGTIFGDGWVNLQAGPQYRLRATLAQGDLTRCAQESMAGRQNLRGTILGSVELQGNGPTRNAMSGRGNIQLRDADVYELPVMISLLKLLSIRPPDQNAFSTSDIDFRIQGEHIYFDRIDFKGDAISLLGKGEMDFQKNIRLTFHAIVGRGELDLPLLKELFRGASQQIMLIHVGGTLHDPETRKEAFPGVNQALQQLSDDLQINPNPSNQLPEARRWMPNVEGSGEVNR